MKIVFLLRNGVIEWTVPEELLPTFNFGQIARKVRLDGYFIGDNIYIRHSELIGMSLADGNATPSFKPAGSMMQ